LVDADAVMVNFLSVTGQGIPWYGQVATEAGVWVTTLRFEPGHQAGAPVSGLIAAGVGLVAVTIHQRRAGALEFRWTV
jgi:hypothetical protein